MLPVSHLSVTVIVLLPVLHIFKDPCLAGFHFSGKVIRGFPAGLIHLNFAFILMAFDGILRLLDQISC